MIGAIQGNVNMSTDMMAQMREKMFAQLDTDSDGQINLAELEAQAAEKGDDVHFTEMLESLTAADTDGDGMVSQTEFEAMEPPSPPPPPPTEGDVNSDILEELPDFISALYSNDGTTAESTNMSGILLDLLG